jgi:glycosyltransferase involved in cell wall biosynthesis
MLKECIIFAMPMSNKRVIVSVTNDLVTDQRVHKVCTYLHEKGCDVTLVGRKFKSSVSLNREYKTKRMRLLFTKGALFYAEYNKRLFFYLLFKKADILLANDLDTLLANKTASRFKSCILVYDSHEFFTEVPELVNRPRVQRVWERIERRIFPKLQHIYTVNKSIAKLYQDRYNKEIKVVRNVSRRFEPTNIPSREELGLPTDKRIIILQGAGINIDRGSEELLEAMNYLTNFHLLIVGSGDVVPMLKNKAEGRLDVTFVGRKNYETMMEYTANADIGVSLDKDTNMNYRYSLPNKIFDYIHAGIPVLVSDLVEVRSIIDQYQIGAVIPSHDPEVIAESIRTFFLGLNQEELSQKLAFAAAELNWNNETKVLDSIYDPILNS